MTQQDIKTLTEIIVNTQSQLAEQLTEFKTDIDAKFEQIDARFEQVDSRFERIDLTFGRFESRLDRVEARLERLEDDTRIGFDRVNTTLDGIAGLLDADDTERVALSAQVTRHEDWIVRTAPGVGVEYVPGA